MNLLELARSAIPEAPVKRVATLAEAAELRALIEVVIADAPHEWAEVHRIACADVVDALTCFRSLATTKTT